MSDDAFRDAAETELEEADPLPQLEWKLPMTRNTIVATLRGLAGGTR